MSPNQFDALEQSGAVEAAALSRLHDAINKRQAEAARLLGVELARGSDSVKQDHDERYAAARADFVDGFRYGCRWAVWMSGRLSDPKFREAIEALHDILAVDPVDGAVPA